MNRCLPSFLRPALAATLLAATALPALAQSTGEVPGGLGIARNFPDAAVRGKLAISAGPQASINGNPVRMAPGMRLFSPQNSLVMLHTVVGQSFTVNYVIEHSTGMLLSAWILTRGEAEQPRKGSDATTINYRTESDKPPAR